MSGRDALASYATQLEGWVSKGQTPDAKQVSVLTGALQNTAAHDPPLFDTSKTAQLFRERTEMGLLGLHSSAHHVYATDGSLEGGHMGAGVYIVRSGKALRCRVGRSRESRTSLRVETGASYLAMGMFHSCVLEGSWKTAFHTENQPKYAQFQSVGIKDKLNTRALHLAQLTPPS